MLTHGTTRWGLLARLIYRIHSCWAGALFTQRARIQGMIPAHIDTRMALGEAPLCSAMLRTVNVEHRKPQIRWFFKKIVKFASRKNSTHISFNYPFVHIVWVVWDTIITFSSLLLYSEYDCRFPGMRFTTSPNLFCPFDKLNSLVLSGRPFRSCMTTSYVTGGILRRTRKEINKYCSLFSKSLSGKKTYNIQTGNQHR